MTWILLHPDVLPRALGYIPQIIRTDDMRPSSEQIHERYAHGGGWSPWERGKWTMDDDGTMHYPQDDPMEPLAILVHPNGETVRFYDCAIISITNADGTFDVARLD